MKIVPALLNAIFAARGQQIRKLVRLQRRPRSSFLSLVMLTFFRKIRRSIHQSPSFPKYVIYALGEIALVVIGILVAVQLNNRNESQKLLIKEIQVYKEIHSELVETLIDLQDDKEDIEVSFKSSIAVRDMIINDVADVDSLKYYLPDVYNLEQSHPKTSAFESLKSMGLDILSNDSLRQKITTLYQLSIPLIMRSDAAVEYSKFRDKLYPLLEPYLIVDRELVGEERSPQNYAWSRGFNYIKIKNVDQLLEDELFLLTLQQSIRPRWIVIRQHESVVNKINQTLTEIRNEIDNLNK